MSQGRPLAKPQRRKERPMPSRRAAMLKFCRSLPHATEDVKWKKDLIFSVGEKMFAGFDVRGGDAIGFNTTPETFETLTQQEGIVPAPYAARFHWVSVADMEELPLSMLKDLVRESYNLVAAKLPAKVRRKLGLG